MHVCELILRLKPQASEPEGLKRLVGGEVVDTMAAVGARFGVTANTVKQSWRHAGMPGESGRYPLAEILIWKLAHDAKNAAGNSARPNSQATSTRLVSIEKRLAKLEAKLAAV